ncbi:hypothetical protein ALI144C_07510 [Actinosynnema sp. ALI-1.44]|uniref:AfsR/SARP family transcriptional regulator n=1 Tax=Actinosynnema sp. ALI-1.44 TaxID=1933779 RepID=UPI00097CBC5F|nr:BTAD domain-containing putative transcriptional regulator [Actinosynnema sp. ALI-1.44]ONI88276.1 hypothetical protein ALI144C_07510 [Actinosynnema sp. ALI-1.44]
MEFRILGPVQAEHEQRLLPLGGTRQRAVLAALLLDAGRVVGIDKLTSAVWGDRPPATVRAQIQICVSALRRLGLPIESTHTGYLLAVDPDDIDAVRFETLVSEARAATSSSGWYSSEAVEALRTALALWRGPALDGLPGLAAEATWLDESRLVATGDLIDAEIQHGRHVHLVGELSALVREHPLQERFHAQLMLVLYRSSRQADALQAYRGLQRMMRQELGLEPGPELQSLERRILARDPSLDQPAKPVQPVTAERHQAVLTNLVDDMTDQPTDVSFWLPPDSTVFTGRVEEIDEISELLLAPRAKAASVVVLTGLAGVGKTALAVRVAHWQRHAFPDGTLFVDVARSTGRPVSAQDCVVQLLRQLGTRPEDLPAGPQDRLSLYIQRTGSCRALLIFDDVDDERLVRSLLPRDPRCAVLITSRRRLTALEGARLKEVDVLATNTAVEMLAEIAGQERVGQDIPAAERIAVYCDGLPFALRIAASRLQAKPHWPVSRLARRLADERTRLDELQHADLDLRDVLDSSYTALSPRLRRAFRLLGLLATPYFPIWFPVVLLAESEDEAEDLVESLLDDRLLTVAVHDRSKEIRYSFPCLVRLYARERAVAEDPEAEREAALERVRATCVRLTDLCGFLQDTRRARSDMDEDALAPLDPATAADLLADPGRWLADHQDLLDAAMAADSSGSTAARP